MCSPRCSPAGAFWDASKDLSEPQPMDSRNRTSDWRLQAQTQGAENTLQRRYWENVWWKITTRTGATIIPGQCLALKHSQCHFTSPSIFSVQGISTWTWSLKILVTSVKFLLLFSFYPRCVKVFIIPDRSCETVFGGWCHLLNLRAKAEIQLSLLLFYYLSSSDSGSVLLLIS